MQLLQLQLNACNILNVASMNSDKVLIYPTIIVLSFIVCEHFHNSTCSIHYCKLYLHVPVESVYS